MSGMWKQLFAEPPPDAMQNLLTPRRKFVYGLIAFAPGTLLALYLSSVKRQMNEENEQLRLKHVKDKLAGEVAREQKDLVLTQMVEELRERIQQLEREARGDTIAQKATESPTPSKKATKGDETSESAAARAPPAAVPQASASRTELPSFLTEYEDALRPWLDRFDLLKAELEKLQERLPKPAEPSTDGKEKKPTKPRFVGQGDQGASGIRERVAEREREMLAQDIREHKQQVAQSGRSP